jgi:ADP-ribose pyrophosphatase YjhB (NUDIX family)
MKFCTQCGGPLEVAVPKGDNLPRHICSRCGHIHYQNPRLVVGCVPEWEGRVLLCRRAIEPRYGFWTLPAGFMENSESTAQAAARETLEEACAEVEIIAPLAMVDVPRIDQVHLMFRARLLRQDFAAGHETLEVGLFTEQDIPWRELAFPSVVFTLRRYFEDRAGGSFGFHRADAADIPF